MTDKQKETHETFTDKLYSDIPVYWWYDYEDAVFRSHPEGSLIRYFVKHHWNHGNEFEVDPVKSNMLMDSISDLDKVLITKEDYENFPQEAKFKQ